MLITEITRWDDSLEVHIQEYPGMCPVFDLQTTPTVELLIQKLLDWESNLSPEPHTPPDDPYAARFQEFKIALEGQIVGEP